MRYKHKCKRCGGEWESIPERPVQCRLCGSALWDRERVRKLGGGRPKEVQAEGTRRIVGTGVEYGPAEEDQSVWGKREETIVKSGRAVWDAAINKAGRETENTEPGIRE